MPTGSWPLLEPEEARYVRPGGEPPDDALRHPGRAWGLTGRQAYILGSILALGGLFVLLLVFASLGWL